MTVEKIVEIVDNSNATYAPVTLNIENRVTGEIKTFYLREIEALEKGELELSPEDKVIIVNGFISDLRAGGIANLSEYEKGLADGNIKPYSKVILSRKDI